MRVYIHLLDEDLPEPDFMDGVVAPLDGNKVATRATETTRDAMTVNAAGTA